jgi:RNA polymerase sigma-70 factor (ECF subfamily)
LDAPTGDLPADIQLAMQGNAAAYERIVRRFQDGIAKRMWRFSRERGTIEELTQEVFVQAYFSLPRFRGDAPFEHWLQKIATRVGYAHWKKRKLERDRAAARTEATELRQAAMDGRGDDVDRELVQRLLAALPPRDRLVVMLMYVDGCSVAEAAEQTGWSQTMVKVQAFRARAKMKKLLEAAGYDGGGMRGALSQDDDHAARPVKGSA